MYGAAEVLWARCKVANNGSTFDLTTPLYSSMYAPNSSDLKSNYQIEISVGALRAVNDISSVYLG